jgi:hypothetical protein
LLVEEVIILKRFKELQISVCGEGWEKVVQKDRACFSIREAHVLKSYHNGTLILKVPSHQFRSA